MPVFSCNTIITRLVSSWADSQLGQPQIPATSFPQEAKYGVAGGLGLGIDAGAGGVGEQPCRRLSNLW